MSLYKFLFDFTYGFFMLGWAKWMAAGNVESDKPSLTFGVLIFISIGYCLFWIVLGLYRFVEHESERDAST